MEPRDLPSVDAVVSECATSCELPTAVIAHVARMTVQSARAALIAGDSSDVDVIADARRALADLEAARPRSVVNATGVLLHTNLGRAPLHRSAAGVTSDLGTSASNVEIDIRTGRRAKRHTYLRSLIEVVTGAEDGLAVNNNAGALLLALASVAGNGGRIAVSRGELIEIGGSFRLPSLMEASGAELVEVGTTNRTRLSDYAAVADSVDAILKVHPSNYRIDGFTEEASYEDLVDLAHRRGVPLVADVGSGLLDEQAPWVPDSLRSWLRSEPGVKQTVALGADLVLFSGDKLLGGPQAGLIAGTHTAVSAARSHPIARAVRLDGPTIGALASTLEFYAANRVREIPFWSMATMSIDELSSRARVIAGNVGDQVEIVESEAVPGAGSVPGETIPSIAIRVPGSADDVWAVMASMPRPVVATRRDGAVLVDLRSVRPEDDDAVAAAITSALG